MAIRRVQEPTHFAGLSTDDKPVLPANKVGSRLFLTDTGQTQIWTGAAWVNLPGSPLESLTEGYLHVGVAGLTAGSSGLQAGHRSVPNDRTLTSLRFLSNAPQNNLPDGVTLGQDGNINLSNGAWLLCASCRLYPHTVYRDGTRGLARFSIAQLVVDRSDPDNPSTSINHRHAITTVLHDFDDANADVDGFLSVTGAVVVTGADDQRIRIYLSVQADGTTDGDVTISSAHLHGFKQLTGVASSS